MRGAEKCIAVLGNGGFGTALAWLAWSLGHRVRLWGHDPEYTAQLASTRENERYLPGLTISDDIEISSDAAQVLVDADVVLSVIPTQHVSAVFDGLGALVPSGTPIISCSKGMEQDTGALPIQLLEERVAGQPIYVISGPCHAEELVQGKPATLVLAGPEGELLEDLQATLSGQRFRLYRSTDILGVSLGGALKNIVAIAAGMCDGLELGDNAKSALLTRGLAEITRFGVALGARAETFSGLAGIGDLITTSVSPHGRNRGFGERLGRGETLSQILATTRKVAEGVWTCRAVLTEAARLGVDMPIAAEVSRVLFEDKPAKAAANDLMTRLLREEG